MFFSKIKGHGIVLSELSRWVLEDKIQGSYIFQGPKGIGKHTIARLVSKYVLCNGTKDDSCRCNVCQLYPNIPDILDIDTDGAIKVTDIQSVESFLSLVPYQSSKRVVILNNLDSISYSAANGLLKIFEELKKYAIIIAVSSNPQKILPPLKSRATPIEFNSLSPDDYIDILKCKGFPAKNINVLSRAIPYLSQSVLSDYSIYMEEFKYIPKFVSKLHSLEEDDLFSIIGRKNQDQSLIHFVEAFILYLNDMLKVYYDSEDYLVYEPNFEDLVKSRENISDEICLASIEKLRLALRQYNRGVNVNLRTRILSAFFWTYTLIQSHKAKESNEHK